MSRRSKGRKTWSILSSKSGHRIESSTRFEELTASAKEMAISLLDEDDGKATYDSQTPKGRAHRVLTHLRWASEDIENKEPDLAAANAFVAGVEHAIAALDVQTPHVAVNKILEPGLENGSAKTPAFRHQKRMWRRRVELVMREGSVGFDRACSEIADREDVPLSSLKSWVSVSTPK